MNLSQMPHEIISPLAPISFKIGACILGKMVKNLNYMVEGIEVKYLPANPDAHILGGKFPKSDLGIWVGTEESGYFVDKSGNRIYPRDPDLKPVGHTVNLVDGAPFRLPSAGPDD